MDQDISRILAGWEYVPGDLNVRMVDGNDGRRKIQVRMDLGLMQLEWSGRPDARRPHGCTTLLEYYREKHRRWEREHPGQPFVLSRKDCWALSQEAATYYWRRISFFRLKEYERAERDAVHNLAILNLCWKYAGHDEDRAMAEHHTPFVTAHRFQARAMRHLARDDYMGSIREIHAGIACIEGYLREAGQFDRIEACPEIRFLRDWEEELQQQRPLTEHEQLRSDLEEAVACDEFEKAAVLRDKLQQLEAGTDDPEGEEDEATEAE